MYEAESAEKIALTLAERQQIDHRARRDLVDAVVSQILSGLLIAVICWVVASRLAAMSSLAGTGAYVLPNAVFALRLWLATYRPGGASPDLFFLGEFLKIGATILLLWLVAWLGGDQVQWPAVLVGLVAALKGYAVLLVIKGSRAK